MTMYEIPAEPETNRLWTRDPETNEVMPWARVIGSTCRADRWYRAETTRPAITWPELLALGPVYDVHPDLADMPATPWKAIDDRVEDATGRDLLQIYGMTTNPGDERVAEFIATAVNAYVATLKGGTQ